jgi:cytochrome P450
MKEMTVLSDPIVDSFGRSAPEHVPPELIRKIDIFNDPELDRDPFVFARRLRDEPPLVYNMQFPMKGQGWLVTRAVYHNEVLMDPKRFSNLNMTDFADVIGERWRFGLLEMDPPEHGLFRRAMNPWLSPSAVGKLLDRVRGRAVELIDQVAGEDGCDFINAFGTPFPVSIFMELMGLPMEKTDLFLKWVADLLHTDDRVEVSRSIVRYLRELVADRKANPRDDFTSRIAQLEIEGERISDDDMLGLCYLIFTGGLDTVASSLSFHFKYLAEDQELQARLRAHPESIPKAVEEFVRIFSPSGGFRQVTTDTEIAGIRIKAGDWIHLHNAAANLDPAAFPNPDVVDIDRPINRHVGFGTGVHHCYGVHLARRELQIAVEEWLTRIPPFRIDERVPVETHGGIVFGVSRMRLRWD